MTQVDQLNLTDTQKEHAAQFDKFYEKYTELTVLLKTFPIPKPLFSLVMQFLDTGFLLVKESFTMMSYHEDKDDQIIQ